MNAGYHPTVFDVLATPVLAIVLIILSVVDLRDFRLPDVMTYPVLAVGLALSAIREGTVPFDSLIGASAGYLTFWVLGLMYLNFRNTIGLGLGDAKLLAAAGAWMGWQALPTVVLLSSISALMYALLGGKLNRQDCIAYGPWLSCAFIFCWFSFLLRGFSGAFN